MLDAKIVTGVVSALLLATIPVSSVRAQQDAMEGENQVIVITGSRTDKALVDTVVATEVITGDDIEATGAHDVAALLADHPGIEATDSVRGTAIRMQGLGSKYVLVLVNGQRAVGRIRGDLDLSRFSTENIERLEIVKGAASALYGADAIAGVINIITKTSESPLELDWRNSRTDAGGADSTLLVGHSGRTWRMSASGGFHNVPSFDTEPSTVATTGDESQQWNGEAAASVDIGHWVISANGDFQRRRSIGIDETYTGATLDRTVLSEFGRVGVQSTNRGASAEKITLSADLSFFHDQYLQDQRMSDELDTYERTEEKRYQVGGQWDRLIGDRHQLSVGTEAMLETLDSDRLDGRGNRYRGSLYAQDEWMLDTEKLLMVVAGFRLDMDSQFGVNPTPSIALRLDPVEELALRLSYGWGFRPPDFRELLLRFSNPGTGYRVTGNPQLKPEVSQNLNFGADWQVHSMVQLTGSLFYNEIGNLIDFQLLQGEDEMGVDVFQYVNTAAARTMGGEGRVQISRSGVRVGLGYSFVATRDLDTGRELPNRPRHRVTAQASYRHEAGFHVALRGSVMGRRHVYRAEERFSTERTTNLGGRLEQQIFRYADVFVGARNLFNAGDEFMPMQPRTFYAGLNLRWQEPPTESQRNLQD